MDVTASRAGERSTDGVRVVPLQPFDSEEFDRVDPAATSILYPW